MSEGIIIEGDAADVVVDRRKDSAQKPRRNKQNIAMRRLVLCTTTTIATTLSYDLLEK